MSSIIDKENIGHQNSVDYILSTKQRRKNASKLGHRCFPSSKLGLNQLETNNSDGSNISSSNFGSISRIDVPRSSTRGSEENELTDDEELVTIHDKVASNSNVGVIKVICCKSLDTSGRKNPAIPKEEFFQTLEREKTSSNILNTIKPCTVLITIDVNKIQKRSETKKIYIGSELENFEALNEHKLFFKNKQDSDFSPINTNQT